MLISYVNMTVLIVNYVSRNETTFFIKIRFHKPKKSFIKIHDTNHVIQVTLFILTSLATSTHWEFIMIKLDLNL